MLGKLKRIYAQLNRNRYLSYLKSLGADIGDKVYFVNPRKTNFDFNRALYISIGNECVICAGVSIIAHDYSWTIPMKAYGSVFPTGGGTIKIGNNVFIGENATILRNVKVGNNVIIGAGSIVTSNVEDDSVYAGVPARKIMSLKEYSEKLKQNYSNEIATNICVVSEKKGRMPYKSEMMNFCFDFLQRNDQGEKSVLGMSWIGCDKRKVLDLFKHSSPNENNYEDFIKRHS